DRDGTRARRRGLPRAALPDARLDLVVGHAPRDLHVRTARKTLMRLEQRADARQLGRVALDDGVRVAHLHGGHADAVALLRLPDRDLAQILLDEAVFAQLGPDLTRADADRHDIAAVPACRDAGAVTRHLCLRAVRVPDHDLDPVVAPIQDLQEAVTVGR